MRASRPRPRTTTRPLRCQKGQEGQALFVGHLTEIQVVEGEDSVRQESGRCSRPIPSGDRGATKLVSIRTLAHRRALSRLAVELMAFKRSRVRLPSAPLTIPVILSTERSLNSATVTELRSRAVGFMAFSIFVATVDARVGPVAHRDIAREPSLTWKLCRGYGSARRRYR